MTRVLLIEADLLLAENLKTLLKRVGHKVIWHRDLQAAIETVDRYQPDVVVMDLVTGGHSGIEFLYELRSYPEWQALPVIVNSSLSPQELVGVDKALGELNVASFHYKPKSTLAEVVEAVDRITRTARV